MEEGEFMVISFDLDGVVMYSAMSSGAFRFMENEIAKWIRKEEDISQEEAINKVWEYLHEVSGKMRAEEEFVDGYNWQKIIPIVQKKLGMNKTIDFNYLIWKSCKENKGYTYPGVRRVLEDFQDRNLNLIATTNGLSSYQYPCLEALDLKKYFQKVITIDYTGYAKPRQEAFSAGEIFSAPRVHIGDSLLQDIGGANNAGWCSILYWPGMPESTQKKSYWRRSLGEKHFKEIEDMKDKGLLELYNLNKENLFPDAIIAHMNEMPQLISEIQDK